MALQWDVWIDYHRCYDDGRTRIQQSYVETGIELLPGSFIVVGNEEAEPAVAEVVTIEPDGWVVIRVLPGPAEPSIASTAPVVDLGGVRSLLVAQGRLSSSSWCIGDVEVRHQRLGGVEPVPRVPVPPG